MPTIPVILLSGFLGSGKTTLLNELLQCPEFDETALLINEFGDIPLDQVLVRNDGRRTDDGVFRVHFAARRAASWWRASMTSYAAC
jgi:G3E family GTPase